MKIKVVERKLGRHCHNKHFNVVGLAYSDEHKVLIDPRQSSRDRLDTLIHECLHVIFPNLDECDVTVAAMDISRVLWEDRFRRVEE